MSSVKCPQCGLVLWATAQSCKRCGAPMPTAYNQSPSQPYYQSGPSQAYQSGSYQTQTPEQTAQANYQTQNSYTPSESAGGYQNNDSQAQNNQTQYGYNQQQSYQSNYGQPNYNQPNYNQTNYNQQGYGYGPQYGQAHASNWGYQQPFAQMPPKKTGLAMTSMILGIVGLLSCGLIGIGAILGGIFGVIGLSNAKKSPQEFGGEGMAIAGIALNALGVIIFILFLSMAIPNFKAAYRAANEGSARATMRSLHSAEMTYQDTAGQGQYATLQQLLKQGLIDKQLASGTKNGYLFTINVQQNDCAIYGTPLDSSSGSRSFYISCSEGLMRGANKNGSPADNSDPMLDSDDYSSGPPKRRNRDYDDVFDDD